MKPVERLAQRLEREHSIKMDARTFTRTRAGHWQRSSGAWSWWAYLVRKDSEAYQTIGSQYGVTALLKSAELEVGKSFCDIEIDPK